MAKNPEIEGNYDLPDTLPDLIQSSYLKQSKPESKKPKQPKQAVPESIETNYKIEETSQFSADDESQLVSRCKQYTDKDENQLRPLTWEAYCGQNKLKEKLQIYIQAAKERNECLDHVLLYGPPGLGKTTLAGIIAHEMQANLRITSGPALEKAGDLAALLTSLKEGDILFIDEIHRLSRQVEEVLYPAIEDFSLDVIIGKGPGARSIRLDLPKFTLIGATTRAGLLSSPLRDRFGVIEQLQLYNEADLAQIIERACRILHLEINEAGQHDIARRSRGTPRIALRLLRRVRDFAQIKGNGLITAEIADYALDKLEIDKLGLDASDRKLLNVLATNYDGGPCGLETLAAALNEDASTLEDVNEPYLMQIGFLAKTARGRVLTTGAWQYLRLTPGTNKTDTNSRATIKQLDWLEIEKDA